MTTQRILTQTYVLSRIRYAAEIYYPRIARSSKRILETAIRGMVRNVYGTSQSSPTKYLNQITNLIPLGV